MRAQVEREDVRLTLHAQQEMAEEMIYLDDLYHAVTTGSIIENYPDHRRGACCLLWGFDRAGRDIHVVCTTEQPLLVIITAYLPKPPKWLTPDQRGERS
jgi:hypothetical protein